MEKTRRRKIVFNIVNLVLMVLIFAGMFAISMSAGFAAIAFSILGAAFAANSKLKKMQQEFYNKLIEHREDLLAGKIITICADEDEISVMISEPKVKKQKKSAEKPAE